MLNDRIHKHHTHSIRKPNWKIPAAVLGCLVLALGLYLLYANKVIHTPNKGSAVKKNFVVVSGQGAGVVTENLRRENLISNSFIFTLYLNYKGIGDKVQAGKYQIAGNLRMTEVAGIITTGKVVTNKITIPEGWTNNQIADYIDKNTEISKSDFLKEAIYRPERDNYDFLANLKPGDSLEGFLYPDTYQISLKPTANEVVKKMLANFDKKLSQKDRDQIKKSGLNAYEVVTLASIVEREVSKPEDRKVVASVFLNRLNAGMPLESCATIQYILNSTKTIFTYEETRTPSLYNTYLNVGLPKGPIGNPSIESIEAVLFPERTSYFYFLSSNGVTYFSKTLDEHNAKKYQYLK